MPRRKMYRVRWEFEVKAQNPAEAAEEAYRVMQDPESIATYFTVRDRAGNEHSVDLRFDEAKAVVQDLKTRAVDHYPL